MDTTTLPLGTRVAIKGEPVLVGYVTGYARIDGVRNVAIDTDEGWQEYAEPSQVVVLDGLQVKEVER